VSSDKENTGKSVDSGRADSPTETKNLPVPVPDSAYTIPARRLSGSPACMNCGTELQGPFCHYCGQPDKNLMRFFPVLMREMLEDFVDFDSRFMRSLKPLLFKPGKLTRDYLDGKRFRYVPPLRLYIFSSIAFFFLAALFATDAVQIQTSPVESDSIVAGNHISDRADEEQRGDRAAEEDTQSADPQTPEPDSRAAGEDAGLSDHEHGVSFDLNGKPWDKETNPLVIPFLPDRMNDWINDEIEESPQKGKAIEENPNLIWDKVFEVLPITMFVLLPIVALLFKFWYLFAGKYYVEHLIFALHNHAFIFVVFLFLMLSSALVGWQEPQEDGPLSMAMVGINVAAWTWIPIYLLVSLKRVYGQRWGMTVLKFVTIGISYFMLLMVATIFVAILSFVLL
jgi:hypothetical protein